MKVTRFQPFDGEGATKGFLNLSIPKWGVTINDMTYCESGDNKWLSLPSKAYKKNGETKYAPIIRFDSIELRDQFLARAMDALNEYLQQTKPEDDGEFPF